MLPLILGSSSAPRKELLERLKLPFITYSPDIDETPLPDETPDQLVLRLAVTKAKTTALRYPAALIIGCDQVATFAGKAFSKPESVVNAQAQLQLVSGQKIRYVNGLCLYNSQTKHLQSTTNYSDVTFRPLTETIINQYLERDHPLHCAGSLRSEGLGIALLTSIDSNDPTCLIGLPLISLVSMLANEGVSVFENN